MNSRIRSFSRKLLVKLLTWNLERNPAAYQWRNGDEAKLAAALVSLASLTLRAGAQS